MEDEQILKLFWLRSELAIRELERKYGRLCSRVARGVLADAQDVEECVSDALLAVWNSIPPARPDSLMAYLCRTVRNQALKKYRYNRAEKRGSCAALPLDELAVELGGGDTTAEGVDARLLGQAINVWLHGLTPERRKIFVLRYWYSASVEEIARAMACSQSKVKSALFRMRGELRVYLEKEGFPL